MLRDTIFLVGFGDLTNEKPGIAWPFADQQQWDSNLHRVNDLAIPPYDPAIHNRQVLPWWDRIQSSVGFAVLLGLPLSNCFDLSLQLTCIEDLLAIPTQIFSAY